MRSKALAVAMSVALVFSPTLARVQAVQNITPHEVFVLNTTKMILFDFSEYHDNIAGFVDGETDLTIRVSRTGSDHGSEESPLLFGSREEVVSNGVDLDARVWNQTMEYKLSKNTNGLVLAVTSWDGQIFSMEFPWAAIRNAPESSVKVGANGRWGEFHPSVFNELWSGVAPPAGEASKLEDLLSGLSPEFRRGLAEYGQAGLSLHQGFPPIQGSAIQEDGDVTKFEGPIYLMECEAEWMGCLGSLGVVMVSLIGLVLACGSSLVTGGMTAAACIAAFLGVSTAQLLSFSACGALANCLDDPTPSPPGGDDPCGPDDEDCPPPE